MSRFVQALRRCVSRAPDPPQATPAAPSRFSPDSAEPSTIMYAVGDVHGRYDLLERLIEAVEADAAQTGAPAHIVFLGDLVNRGPETRAVLDRMVEGPRRRGDRWTVLRGNHEQSMLDALVKRDKASFRRWLQKGGAETLLSYGLAARGATPTQAAEAVGERHLEFLAALPHVYRDGPLLFVHAGIRPGVALDEQDPADLLSIRGPFLDRPHGLDCVVVHGHSPTKGRPTVRPGRINIDTGAVTTGILTAAAFGPDPGLFRFIQVDAKERTAASTGAMRLSVPGGAGADAPGVSAPKDNGR